MSPIHGQPVRVLAWFSCGSASAVAAKLAVERHGDACEVLYCDTSASEHPDNLRFLADVERWLGVPVLKLRSTEYDGIYHRIAQAGIDMPAMYRLGYKNNNCIGCVKGQASYWNKIRVDFPDVFDRMAKMERTLNAAICKKETTVNGKRIRQRVFLDELPPTLERQPDLELDMECGVLCQSDSSDALLKARVK